MFESVYQVGDRNRRLARVALILGVISGTVLAVVLVRLDAYYAAQEGMLWQFPASDIEVGLAIASGLGIGIAALLGVASLAGRWMGHKRDVALASQRLGRRL